MIVVYYFFTGLRNLGRSNMYDEIEEVKEAEIDIEKVYDFPDFIVKEYQEKYLIIAPETGNWLILSSKIERDIFEFLSSGNSIRECLKKYEEGYIIEVLTQIEAKEFESKEVHNIDNAETMQLYLTNACNLRCKHCYMYAEHSLENELSSNEIISLCTAFKESGGKYVTITGGEISVRKDIITILQEINKTGLGIHILSNGVFWTDQLIETVSSINVERVQISLDGFDEYSNAKIRGTGTFDKAIHTIDRLVKKGVNVYIAVTPLYDILVNNKEEYIKFAKALIDKYKNYKFLVNFSFELIEGRDVSNSDIIKYNELYMDLMREICEEVYPGSELESFVLNHNDKKIFNNCGYGRLNISSVGDVYFCSRITEVRKYANIRKDSFDRILELMSRIRELSDISSLRPCCDCELKYICGGGCRVDKFGSLTQLDDIFEDNIIEKINQRQCSTKNKEYLYKLMIEANERLYR